MDATRKEPPRFSDVEMGVVAMLTSLTGSKPCTNLSHSQAPEYSTLFQGRSPVFADGRCAPRTSQSRWQNLKTSFCAPPFHLTNASVESKRQPIRAAAAFSRYQATRAQNPCS